MGIYHEWELTMSADIVEQGVRFVLKPEGEGKKLMKNLIMTLLTPSYVLE
jgi:hypothetical protein